MISWFIWYIVNESFRAGHWVVQCSSDMFRLAGPWWLRISMVSPAMWPRESERGGHPAFLGAFSELHRRQSQWCKLMVAWCSTNFNLIRSGCFMPIWTHPELHTHTHTHCKTKFACGATKDGWQKGSSTEFLNVEDSVAQRRPSSRLKQRSWNCHEFSIIVYSIIVWEKTWQSRDMSRQDHSFNARSRDGRWQSMVLCLAEVRAIGATNLNTAVYLGRDRVATASPGHCRKIHTLGDGPTWSASSVRWNLQIFSPQKRMVQLLRHEWPPRRLHIGLRSGKMRVGRFDKPLDGHSNHWHWDSKWQ